MRIELQSTTLSGRGYTVDEAAQLRDAMAQAMKLLPDIRALFADDPDELRRALSANYNVADVEESWV